MPVDMGASGFTPMYTPLDSQVQKFTVINNVTVYVGMPVILTAAGISQIGPNAAVTAKVLGICLENVLGDGTKTASVCIDPNMAYRVKGNAAPVPAKFGLAADIVANTGSASTGQSLATLDVANTVATGADGATPWLILGEYAGVSNMATNTWTVVKNGFPLF